MSAEAIAPAQGSPLVRHPGRGRRLLGWLALAAAIVMVGGITLALSGLGDWAQRDALDPRSPAPNGTLALAELLRAQGVEVQVTDSHSAALELLSVATHAASQSAAQSAAQGGTGGATLVFGDNPALGDDTMASFIDAAVASGADLVLLSPRSRALDTLLPGATRGGAGPAEAVPAECSLDAASNAGPIRARTLLRAGDTALTACYPSDDEAALLARERSATDSSRSGGARDVALDAAGLFTNDSLANDGNAALALALLGRHQQLVWYVPSPLESDGSIGAPGIGELTPPWVTPALVMVVITIACAAVWKGRRFGPLVRESLPVTVRVSETMQGRARLYAAARDHAHAADVLRRGTCERLAHRLGLQARTEPRVIADAVASATGSEAARVHAVLWQAQPRNDAELLRLASGLRDLEAALAGGPGPGAGAGAGAGAATNVHGAARGARRSPKKQS